MKTSLVDNEEFLRWFAQRIDFSVHQTLSEVQIAFWKAMETVEKAPKQQTDYEI